MGVSPFTSLLGWSLNQTSSPLFHSTINDTAFLTKAGTEDSDCTLLCDLRAALTSRQACAEDNTFPKDLSRASFQHLPKHQRTQVTQIPVTCLSQPAFPARAAQHHLPHNFQEETSAPIHLIPNRAKEAQHFTLALQKIHPLFCIIQIKSDWKLAPEATRGQQHIQVNWLTGKRVLKSSAKSPSMPGTRPSPPLVSVGLHWSKRKMCVILRPV